MDSLLYNVLENSLNGIVLFSAIRAENGEILDFRYLYMNKTAEILIKRKRNELLGNPLCENFSGIKATGLFEKFVHTVETGQPSVIEFYYDRDNLDTWFRASLLKIEDGFVLTFVDIGDEKKKEHQIAEFEEIFTDTFELSRIGIYEWNIPLNRIYWSDELYRIYGYEPHEFAVTPDLHLKIIHPEDREYISDINRNLFRQPAHEYKYYYRFIRKDGSIGVGYGKGRSFTDENGKFIKMRGYVQDISERKKTETLLSETQEIGHIGSFEFDFKTETVSGTAEFFRIYEHEKDSITFEEILNKIHPEDRANIINKTRAMTGTDEAEFRLVRSDGTIRHIWSRGKTYKSQPGDRLTSVGLIMDITEIKTARQKLEKLNAELELRISERTRALQQSNDNLKKTNSELDRFAYVISHDLKSPLSSLEGLIGFIIDESRDKLSVESYEMLEMAIEKVHHMSSMINSLLQTARGAEKVREPIDVNTLIADVTSNMYIPSSIHLHIQKNLPVINFHKVSLIQVFQNLIGNSVKFMDKTPGIVKIGFEKKEKEYIFCISDNGPGISETNREKIFNLFETGGKSTTESTGIGLSIVKKIIEENKGRIWLESELKKGATFYFSLPVTVYSPELVQAR
jgi:PAS domain S-box-containing protein